MKTKITGFFTAAIMAAALTGPATVKAADGEATPPAQES